MKIVVLIVNGKSSMCSSLKCEDEYLDRELHKWEIEKCMCKLNITRRSVKGVGKHCKWSS